MNKFNIVTTVLSQVLWIRPLLIQWLQHVEQPKCEDDLYLEPMVPYTYSFTATLFTDFMAQ